MDLSGVNAPTTWLVDPQVDVPGGALLSVMVQLGSSVELNHAAPFQVKST